ncbi:hypothetical protein SAY87_005040 [Trapa incisa]|uniref:K Homology domain-containing protein n=1 Tax=Trapa incisa TaxID=236973 RepID=A0AAN7JQR4_9MYRT|nr:hypothetical protein SAY87_005040 [Trapa incisa]
MHFATEFDVPIGGDIKASSGGRFMAYSPSPSTSPHVSGLRSSSPALSEQEKYLNELFAELQKFNVFKTVLPHSSRLLIQEILRVTTMLGNASVLGQTAIDRVNLLASRGMFSNGGADLNGRASRFPSEIPRFIDVSPLTITDSNMQFPSLVPPSSAQSWPSPSGSSSGIIVKKNVRLDVPVDKYPNYNFVGRLLGPRGNSLKRVEARTDCRILIRGRGSIKDPVKEEIMRGKPGYEHLNEPLHILLEAELPAEIIDARLFQARDILLDLLQPVDESQDFYKKQQLRELAMLNGTLREEGSPMSGSISPYQNSLSMKRAKTHG